MASRYGVVLLAAIIVSFLPAAFAQEEGMRKPTSDGALEIALDPEWSEGSQPDLSKASLKVTFIDPETGQVHEHQDYDVVIMKDGKEIFSAARETGQAVLHNVPGTLTVPYEFQQKGDYVVKVEVLGLGFPPIPINPESAEFPITVTPEFPAGAVGAIAAVMAAAVVMSRRIKI